MNAQAEKTLLEKLKTLPPARLAEVEDFVDFLKGREERTRDEAARSSLLRLLREPFFAECVEDAEYRLIRPSSTIRTRFR